MEKRQEDVPLDGVPVVDTMEAEVHDDAVAVNDKVEEGNGPSNTNTQSCDSEILASSYDVKTTPANAAGSAATSREEGSSAEEDRKLPPHGHSSQKEPTKNARQEQLLESEAEPQPYPSTVLAGHNQGDTTCASSITMNLQDITQGQELYPSGQNLQQLLETMEESSTPEDGCVGRVMAPLAENSVAEQQAQDPTKQARSQATRPGDVHQAMQTLQGSLQSLEEKVLESLKISSSSQQGKNTINDKHVPAEQQHIVDLKARLQSLGQCAQSMTSISPEQPKQDTKGIQKEGSVKGSDAVHSARASLVALEKQAALTIKAKDTQEEQTEGGENNDKQSIQSVLEAVRANLLELERVALMSLSSSSSVLVAFKEERDKQRAQLAALEAEVSGMAGVALSVTGPQRLAPSYAVGRGTQRGSGETVELTSEDEGRNHDTSSTVVIPMSLPGAYRQGGVRDDENLTADGYNGHVDIHGEDVVDEEAGLGANDNNLSSGSAGARTVQNSGGTSNLISQEISQDINVTLESPDTTGLLTASPVCSEPLQIARAICDDGEAQRTPSETSDTDAPPCDSTKMWTSWSRRSVLLSVGLGCLASMIVLVIVLVLVLPEEDAEDTRKASSEREVTALAMRARLSSLLGEEMFQTSTHAERAWEWLAYEDPMQLPGTASNVLQRFFVVLFYLSTSQQGLWKACNPLNVTSDFCYYEGLWGDGNFDMPGYSLDYQRFEEVLATRWLSGAHECSWAGLLCTDSQIYAMHLDDMNLTGALPSEISLLSGLTTLSLSRNSLTGHLPSELGALGNLTFLDLEQNRFSGRIPSHLIDTALGPAARNLFHLDLSTNIFSSSTIPTELTSMSNLEYLGLNAAGIVGSIPSEIFQLTELDWLLLEGNMITGTLPSEIGRLSDMTILNLKNNQLTGSVPTEVGLLTSLLEIALWANSFSGTIPEELYHENMNINALILGYNNFSGTISSNIARLPSISYVLLSSNPIKGNVPSELGLIAGLERFDVDFTELSGSIPEELCLLRGDSLLSKLKTDCAAGDPSNNTTSAEPAVFCPEGCCTKCCNRETQDCYKTIYNENY